MEGDLNSKIDGLIDRSLIKRVLTSKQLTEMREVVVYVFKRYQMGCYSRDDICRAAKKHGLLCDNLDDTIFHFAKSLYLAGKRRVWDDEDQRYHLDVSHETMRESLQIRDILKQEIRMSAEKRLSPRRASMPEEEKRLSPRRNLSPRRSAVGERPVSPRRSIPAEEQAKRLSPRRSPAVDERIVDVERLSPRKSGQMSPRTVY